MPRQQCGLAESPRCGLVRLCVLVPTPHLQHIDALLAGHQVDKAAAQLATKLFQLMFRVQ